jgi:MYXO-CTERM domain-containing protein
MNKAIKTSLLAFAVTGAAQASTITLVSSNSEVVTGGQVDYTVEILSSQTLYVGIPYSAGAWPSAEATDYFEVATFLLGIGGSSTVSFNFYSANDTGTELSAITPLSGFTAGSASVGEAGSGSAAELGSTSEVTAQVDYANLIGNPFSSLSNGILWLGITNTGANTVSYYAGIPGFGSPLIEYTFGAPLDTTATALVANSYTYNANGTLPNGGPFENVHPYVTITAQTVPEPGAAALGLLGGFLLLRRRRNG